MIKFLFIKENKKIKKINIQGHALYSSKGKDIVCASVSTAIIMTLNIIELLELNSNINYSVKEGFFSLRLLKFEDTINKLLMNLEYTLKDLSKTYSKYLKEEEN